jgi:hypothetical protein
MPALEGQDEETANAEIAQTISVRSPCFAGMATYIMCLPWYGIYFCTVANCKRIANAYRFAAGAFSAG